MYILRLHTAYVAPINKAQGRTQQMVVAEMSKATAHALAEFEESCLELFKVTSMKDAPLEILNKDSSLASVGSIGVLCSEEVLEQIRPLVKRVINDQSIILIRPVKGNDEPPLARPL